MSRYKARLLGRIGETRVYRARLQASPHLRYLNAAALKRARRLELPVGCVSIPGHTVSIVAVIRNGKVTSLRPAGCTDCEPSEGSRRQSHSRKRMALARAVGDKLDDLGLHSPRMPIAVARLTIPIIDISIDIIVGFGVVCIRIETEGGYGCLICPDGITCFRPSD